MSSSPTEAEVPETPEATEEEEIKYDELKKGLEGGTVILIDVRNREEIQEQGAIPNAVNIPLPEVPDMFKNLNETEFKAKFGFDKKATNIAVSCRRGGRAEAAIENLRQLGFTQPFKLYKGSFEDWVAKGGKIIKK